MCDFLEEYGVEINEYGNDFSDNIWLVRECKYAPKGSKSTGRRMDPDLGAFSHDSFP